MSEWIKPGTCTVHPDTLKEIQQRRGSVTFLDNGRVYVVTREGYRYTERPDSAA